MPKNIIPIVSYDLAKYTDRTPPTFPVIITSLDRLKLSVVDLAW